MTGVVARASLRHFRRHPAQLGLATLGIALGVALAVGIDVASASVRRAFTLSTEAITGRATHQIVAGPGGLDEELYRALRLDPDRPPALLMAPAITGAALPVAGGGALQILGVDALAEAPFRPTTMTTAPSGGFSSQLAPLLLLPGAAALTEETARRAGVAADATLEVRVGAHRRRLVAVRVPSPVDPTARRALDGLAIVDVATAQELLGMLGRLSRIDLIVPDGDQQAAALAWLNARLPAGAQLTPVGARVGALTQMTRAFDLNLKALSLLALLVGAFLIFNTMSFSVVQRRPLLAILRTLGADRAQLGRQLLLEGAGFGVAGSTIGLVLGVALSRRLVQLVARVVSDLYFAVSVTDVPLPLPALARGWALGVAVAVAAAWPAARDAMRTEPSVVLQRSALERRARAQVPRVAGAGLALIAAALALLLLSGRSVGLGLGALLALLLGCAALTPAAVLGAARLCAAALGWLPGTTGRLAARNIAASLSRTGVATAALALALSVTTGVGVMVASFRRAVEEWLEGTLRADVYLSAPPAVSSRSDAPLSPGLAERVAALPGVAAIGTNRVVTVDAGGQPTMLMAIAFAPGRRPGVAILSGDDDRAWADFRSRDAVLISEPLAFKRGLAPGGRLLLATDRGPRAFAIAAVYRDYGSDSGAVMMARPTYDRFFDDRQITAIALYASAGKAEAETVDDLVADVRAHLGADDEVLVRPSRALRQASLQIFDRTFEITSVLRLFALIVATLGVTGALLAAALERGRELATLRALGATPGQVARLTLVETGMLGTMAGILAVPLGTVLAAVLVFVINRRSFGWTMPLHLAPRALLPAPLLGAAAGLLAGLYPAFRAARVIPAQALREE